MDHVDARRHLRAEHDRLVHLREVLDADGLSEECEEDSSGELSHVDQHPADVASDAFEREKELAILDRVHAELAAVDRALRRIDEGTYGTCEACGVAIGDERLAAVPAARLCLDHQADVET